jgi:hypothetical protein
VDPEKRQKVTSLLYRAIESARNEQMYKEMNKRLTNIYTKRKNKGQALFKNLHDSKKVEDFIRVGTAIFLMIL